MSYTLSWSREIRGLHATEETGDSIDGVFASFDEAKAEADRFFSQENRSGNRDTLGMSWAVLDDSGTIYETEVVR